jgi:hypothetical protein
VLLSVYVVVHLCCCSWVPLFVYAADCCHLYVLPFVGAAPAMAKGTASI